MKNEKRLRIVVVLYLLIICVLGRLIFMIPNQRYLNILNIDDFYVTSCIVLLAITLLIFFFVKGSVGKKLWMTIFFSIIIFTISAVYFYSNLPQYTYEEAAKKVANAEKQKGKSVQLQIPMYREDKLGVGKESFLQMTNHTYYIYLNVDDKPLVFKFNPLSGQFEEVTGERVLEEYEVQ
ncbi:hypothetical protein C161_27929 [Paenibacillus sp. FSL R5-192]|uniref:hypothetical protein n=1 Tax=Paenibacillus sp. FSL R5-192 TaxID=1226754 RepID=UPI0003E27BA0|nr:hypothetical protein [Paenibacillus sp. FSL R5-192]ETT29888.1 hypothetical protein C161_27929 [Paenibacillus sp. FSL R5-192]